MDKLTQEEIIELIHFLVSKNYNFNEDVTKDWPLLGDLERVGSLSGHSTTEHLTSYEQRKAFGHDISDPEGPSNITFLGRAVVLCQLDVVKCLLESGAVKPNLREISLCLQEATITGRLDVLDYLKLFFESYKFQNTSPTIDYYKIMKAASRGGSLDALKFWMKHGLDLFKLQNPTPEWSPSTPLLQSAAYYDRSEMVSFLVKNGFMLSPKDLNEMTYESENEFEYILDENSINSKPQCVLSVPKDLYPDYLVILARYGIYVKFEQSQDAEPSVVAKITRAREILDSIHKNESLFVKCITAIRKAMGGNVSGKSTSLPLPEAMKKRLTRPVRWEGSMYNYIDKEFNTESDG